MGVVGIGAQCIFENSLLGDHHHNTLLFEIQNLKERAFLNAGGSFLAKRNFVTAYVIYFRHVTLTTRQSVIKSFEEVFNSE